MKSLAKGLNSNAIFKLIKVLISTQQQDYQEALGSNTSGLNDISDQLECDQKLYNTNEIKPASMMDSKFYNFDEFE